MTRLENSELNESIRELEQISAEDASFCQWMLFFLKARIQKWEQLFKGEKSSCSNNCSLKAIVQRMLLGFKWCFFMFFIFFWNIIFTLKVSRFRTLNLRIKNHQIIQVFRRLRVGVINTWQVVVPLSCPRIFFSFHSHSSLFLSCFILKSKIHYLFMCYFL